MKWSRWSDHYDWQPHFSWFSKERDKKIKIYKQGRKEINYFYNWINKNYNKVFTSYKPRERTISYFYKYRVKIKGGVPRLEYIRKRDEGSRDDGSRGPLNNTGKCKFIGITPHYPGQMNGRVFNTHSEVMSTIRKYKRQLKDEFPSVMQSYTKEILKDRHVIGGGLNTSFEILGDYISEGKISMTAREIYEIALPGLDTWLRLPMGVRVEDKDIVKVTRFNRDASPGPMTKILLGRTRKESIPITTQVAMDLFNNIKEIPQKNWNLWELLSREKDCSTNRREGESSPTRIVMNTEEPIMLILSALAQPITKWIQNNKDGSLIIGQKFDDKLSSSISEYRDMFDWTLETDWSNFDANVDDRFLEVFGMVIRHCYPDEREYDRIVYFITKSLIDKYVVVNPGYVYKITKGLASGHAFTSLVGSIVNVIYWCLIGYKIYGENYFEKMGIIVSGDDANVFFTDDENLERIDEIIEELGLKSDKYKGKFKLNNIAGKLQDKPTFLSRHYDHGLVCWSRDRIIRRLIYPTKTKRTLTETRDITIDYMMTGPDDNEMSKFLSFIRKRLGDNKITGSINYAASRIMDRNLNRYKQALHKSKDAFEVSHELFNMYKEKITDDGPKVLRKFRSEELIFYFFLNYPLDFMSFIRNKAITDIEKRMAKKMLKPVIRGLLD